MFTLLLVIAISIVVYRILRRYADKDTGFIGDAAVTLFGPLEYWIPCRPLITAEALQRAKTKLRPLYEFQRVKTRLRPTIFPSKERASAIADGKQVISLLSPVCTEVNALISPIQLCYSFPASAHSPTDKTSVACSGATGYSASSSAIEDAALWTRTRANLRPVVCRV